MKNNIYELYKTTKRLIERTETCGEDHSHEELFKEWREGIKLLDKVHPTYAVRYEREKSIIVSFTKEQIDHICYQIGEWYLDMKPLLEGQHNLGHMKEKLKAMICGE